MKQENIRNFCIIAHIDHGKSTLSDRLLERTDTISKKNMKDRFLDTMDLEREKGITIKLKAVRMTWKNSQGEEYVFNLIDTPGHVDFSYEVSRSLAACEGALLLVDATQGIQAQTLANFYSALNQGLDIIPVINKIDMPNADISGVENDLCENLGFRKDEILKVSARDGTGVETIFPEIVKKIPSPQGIKEDPFRALIFDSVYDQHKGVIVYVCVVDGMLGKRDEVKLLATQAESEILELGYLAPHYQPVDMLQAGDVGYIATGLKDLSLCQVGDTVTKVESSKLKVQDVTSLPGYKKVKPMVFLGLYPTDSGDFLRLKEAFLKIQLTDSSISFTPESSPALGNGFRCGFLGLLHAEIIQERLEREYDLDLIATIPNVEYEIKLKAKSEKLKIKTPFDLPDQSVVGEISEPWVKVSIFSPSQYLGSIMQLCQDKRAQFINTEYIGQRVNISYEIPLAELVIDFYDQLKSISSGYASLDYDLIDFRPVNAVKMDILIAGDKVEAFSQIVVRDQATEKGRHVVKKLKDAIPRQQFKIALQAVIGGKIIAREDISAFRKDVTAKLYGGDVTRKKKLLSKQKKGKKRMKQFGRVSIPQEAFMSVLKK